MPSGENQPFSFLSGRKPQDIARVLMEETPLVSGAVLANLSPMESAKVLACMGSDRQKELIASMRKAKDVPQDVIRKVAAALEKKVGNTGGAIPEKWEPRKEEILHPVNAKVNSESRRQEAIKRTLEAAAQKKAKLGTRSTTPPSDGHKINGMNLAAEILRHASSEIRHNIMDHDPDLYSDLRKRMFIFDDLARSPENALAAVFGAADIRDTALALRFAPEILAKRALASISPRRATLIQEEAALMAGERVQVSEIEKSQENIIKLAVNLQKSGKIIIDPDDPDLQ